MKKEILIVCIILIIIIIIDTVCQKYLANAVQIINNKLEETAQLSMEFIDDEEENNGDVKNKVESLKQEWEEYKKTLSLYVEHDELEKVDTSMVRINTFMDVENYEDAIPEIKECIFILDHIKIKQKISISNLL